MPNFEVLLAFLIFLGSLGLVALNPKRFIYLLLILSVFLHKEVFSVYVWNLLPIRLSMAALFTYMVVFVLWRLFKKDTLVLDSFKNPAFLSLCVFWLLALLSIFFSKNIKASLLALAFFSTVITFFAYVLVLYKDENNILRIIKFYVYLALFLSLIGFLQIWVYYKYNFIFGAFWNIPGHTPRVGSLFWDVNHFAGFLSLLIPICVALFLISDFKRKIFYFVSATVLLVILGLTNARTGWLACMISLAVFFGLLVFRRFKYKGLGLILLIFAVISLFGVFEYLNKQSAFRHKIRTYFHYRLDSFDSHILLLKGSLSVFENFPVLGGGYGGFFEHFASTKISATFFARDPAALNTRVPAHSIWGELLAETGILGFSVAAFFYLTLFFTYFFAALHTKRKTYYILSSAMTGSLCGIFCAGIFYSYNSEFFWYILIFYFLLSWYFVKKEFYGFKDKDLWLKIYSFFISNSKFLSFFILLLSSLLIFINLGTNHLIPYDEAIYAKVSQNIISKNDWLTLYWYEDAPWFEKPPLYFWLSALSLKVFLNNPEFAVRLPSAIFGVLSVFLTYVFGKRLFGKMVGFIAAFVLLTTFHFLYYSRIGMLDVSVTFFILASLYLYYISIDNKAKKKIFYYIFSGVFMGLGVLVKGVVGLLPLLIFVVWEFRLLFIREKLSSRIFRLSTIILCFLFVSLPWHLLMFKLYGSRFVDSYLNYHVLGRALTSQEDKTAPFYWYIVVIKVSMRIWFVSLLLSLPFVAYHIYKKSPYRNRLLFIVLSSSLILLLFSFSKSKLIWYIMPVYPFLSILNGFFLYLIISFVDAKLSRLNNISSLFIKSFGVYLIIVAGLLYLSFNKHLVYTSDYTGSQAKIIKTKNNLYGFEVKFYVDKIEFPLVLFYANKNFSCVDFEGLKKAISSHIKNKERMVFVTKESRFKLLQSEFPNIAYISSQKEWYLGELSF